MLKMIVTNTPKQIARNIFLMKERGPSPSVKEEKREKKAFEKNICSHDFMSSANENMRNL